MEDDCYGQHDVRAFMIPLRNSAATRTGVCAGRRRYAPPCKRTGKTKYALGTTLETSRRTLLGFKGFSLRVQYPPA